MSPINYRRIGDLPPVPRAVAIGSGMLVVTGEEHSVCGLGSRWAHALSRTV